MGVVFPREQTIDLVLVSLPKSYGQFVKNFLMMDSDVTLIDLTQMLIVAEAEMPKSTSKEKMLIGSGSKISKDCISGDSEMISLPNGKGLAKVKQFDRMVKRKDNYEIVPCVIPKESICFYCQLKGHWLRSCPKYLKDLRKYEVNMYDSNSGISIIKLH